MKTNCLSASRDLGAGAKLGPSNYQIHMPSINKVYFHSNICILWLNSLSKTHQENQTKRNPNPEQELVMAWP